MADTFSFELVSPERLLQSGQAVQVTIPGTEGEFTVLAGHAPVLSTIRPGIIHVTGEGSSDERIFIRGGFAEVTPTGLTILAEEAIPMADLDSAALAQQIKNAEEDVADASDDNKRQRAQESLDHLKQLRDAL